MYKKFILMMMATLPIVLSGCMSVPENLDLSLNRLTDQKMYQVEIHSLANPIEVNKIHAWEIKLQTPAGDPVTNAQIDVSGGMPQHGHGLPTRPKVTRALGDGKYLLEGMKFSMTGWWEIKLGITSSWGTDTVTFNKVIEQPQFVQYQLNSPPKANVQ